MSEQTANTTEKATLDPGLVFSAKLDALTEAGIDIGDRLSMEATGQEFINKFELSGEFFEDDVRATLFTAVAHRTTRLISGDARGHEAMYSAMFLIAGEDGPNVGQLYRNEKTTNGLSEVAKKVVYDRFTNWEVTRDLEQAIDSGLLDGVKAKLGITPENEEPYEVRVLNVLDKNGLPEAGMFEYPNLMGVDFLSEEGKEGEADIKNYHEYVESLKQKGREFNRQTGRDYMDLAWVESVEGKMILCLQLPMAEKIVYKNEPTRSSKYDEKARAVDIATLEHEYVHTQQSLLPNHDPFLGIGLEEFRAEHYSGNKQGYLDIKHHFLFLNDVARINVKSFFDRFGPERPFSASAFYTEIAKDVGLDDLLDLVFATPGAYVVTSRKPPATQQALAEYVGGLDVLQGLAWGRANEQEFETEIVDRLRERIARIESNGITVAQFLEDTGDTFIGRKLLEIVEAEKDTTTLRG